MIRHITHVLDTLRLTLFKIINLWDPRSCLFNSPFLFLLHFGNLLFFKFSVKKFTSSDSVVLISMCDRTFLLFVFTNDIFTFIDSTEYRPFSPNTNLVQNTSSNTSPTVFQDKELYSPLKFPQTEHYCVVERINETHRKSSTQNKVFFKENFLFLYFWG